MWEWNTHSLEDKRQKKVVLRFVMCCLEGSVRDVGVTECRHRFTWKSVKLPNVPFPWVLLGCPRGCHFLLWSLSCDTTHGMINVGGKDGQPLPWQNHQFLLPNRPFLLLPEYCIHPGSDLFCTPLPAGVFKSSGTLDGCFWREMLLKLAPREGL